MITWNASIVGYRINLSKGLIKACVWINLEEEKKLRHIKKTLFLWHNVFVLDIKIYNL